MQVFYLFKNSNGLESMWEPQYCLSLGSIMFNDWRQLLQTLTLPDI